MARKKNKRQHHALPVELLDAVARRFRTLGVPSRLRILSSLMEAPLGMAELEREGCGARRREGRTVRVEIADPRLRDLCALVCGALSEQTTPR